MALGWHAAGGGRLLGRVQKCEIPENRWGALTQVRAHARYFTVVQQIFFFFNFVAALRPTFCFYSVVRQYHESTIAVKALRHSSRLRIFISAVGLGYHFNKICMFNMARYVDLKNSIYILVSPLWSLVREKLPRRNFIGGSVKEGSSW